MARPTKTGVDYFPLDCNFSDEIKYIEAEFGLDGFATLVMPIIEKQIVNVPKILSSFTNVINTKNEADKKCGVHFFSDDYKFERIWNAPGEYAQKLTEFECALTPDFSLYLDMPMAMKVWNVYRSRLIGQVMQDYSIKVVPTVQWAEPETLVLSCLLRAKV